MSTGPVVEIDTTKLWQAIRSRLFRTEKHAAEIARHLGFSPTVFTNIKLAAQGRPVRVKGRPYEPGSRIFLSICWWLGEDPRDFQRVRQDALPLHEIDQVLAGES